MERVTGIGGVFFKARDPERLKESYRDHLGVPVNDDGFVVFDWRAGDSPERPGCTVWSLFAGDTTYFAPSSAPFMINYRVADLDAMLAQLRAAGAEVDPRIEDGDYGRFAWVMDPEGNRIELWEPPTTPK